MIWAWIVLGITIRIGLDLFTNARKHRGYINRIFNKLTKVPLELSPFLLPWMLFSFAILLTVSQPISVIIIETVYIIIALDDYLNGDDDLHKKIKRAANKIKWKMTQPKLITRPQ